MSQVSSTPTKSTPPINDQPQQQEFDENDIGLLIALNPSLSSNIEIKIKINESISIGRSKNCNIVISDLIISGKHCIITRADKAVPLNNSSNSRKNNNSNNNGYGLLLVQDMSTNGTFINGKLIGKGLFRVMKTGDKLCLGKSTKEVDISFLYKANKIVEIGSNYNGGNGESYIWEKQDVKDDVLKDYDFIKELGSGNFSVVYEGINKNTGKRVAIKHLNLTKLFTQSPKFKSQLNREIEILKIVNHENVIQIFDIFYTKDQQLFFILELANGGELYNKIGYDEPLLNETQTKFIFKQILNAVYYLHSKGIAHRDLKPENILFESYGDNDDFLKIKITDFGLARFIHEGQLARTLCGSPLFVAPEVIRSLGNNKLNSNNITNNNVSPSKDILNPQSTGYGKSCDAWSLGAILYIMLTGKPPFDDEDGEELSTPQLFEKIISGNYRFPEHVLSSISKNSADLVKRLLTVDPIKRYTIEQALSHPWITTTDINNSNNNINKPISPTKFITTTTITTTTTTTLSKPLKRHLSGELPPSPLPTTVNHHPIAFNNNSTSFISNSLLNQLVLTEEPNKKRKTFYSNNLQSKENLLLANNQILKSSQ